ncbi:PREDICTED: telomere repeat-binding protein 4-like isoform X2 [Lupinus angustifolius]|uniref:telomere repeat-binding protein 4-like isoform X2 n=1 Tax=Lupinus angustifolius TaxID=3871 RepID=UPI00092FCF96|nr:PREDICTED: telomere repeat-binding protein 4-like isoform X2 [Lupinus angustifolius]
MVKRLDYGFRGFQVPPTAKRHRSTRRRGPFKKSAEDGQACAFELLASLAGELLQESESSASNNASEGNHHPSFSHTLVEKERQGEVRPLMAKGIHNGSCAESILFTEMESQKSNQKCLEHAETDCIVQCVSVNNNSNSECSEKVEAGLMSKNCKCRNKFVHHSNRLVEIPEDVRESSDANVKNGFRWEQVVSNSVFKGLPLGNKFCLKDPSELCVNSPSLINSNSNVKSPFCGDLLLNASISRHGNNNKLGFRDDDENFLRCNRVCTKSKAVRPPQRIARRRIRQLLTSKRWKVAPKLKDCEHSRTDGGVKPLYRKRKTCYSFERSRQCTLFKRRKFFGRSSVITSDGGFSWDSVSNSPDKGMDGDSSNSSIKRQASNDSHVKFSIKSFRIPELYIEVPRTSTVGSLKRAVKEAIMGMLRGGMHVGVLLQGKKVRGNNRTLRQTRISCEENLDKLGFVLEPSSLRASPAVCVGEPSQCKTPQLTRSPEARVLDSGISDALQDSSFLTNASNLVESNHESTSISTDTVVDKITTDARALVTVPTSSTKALAVIPAGQKTRHSELVQRRTRRPFSVSEVEGLVEAVEELGTGRWRDVKLRAFENADHRTYVDLKDKWKTLVHTAKIAPQQRRGEPVPQELLDRVLAAHDYWSHHQAKQHGLHGMHHQDGTMKDTVLIASNHI